MSIYTSSPTSSHHHPTRHPLLSQILPIHLPLPLLLPLSLFPVLPFLFSTFGNPTNIYSVYHSFLLPHNLLIQPPSSFQSYYVNMLPAFQIYPQISPISTPPCHHAVKSHAVHFPHISQYPPTSTLPIHLFPLPSHPSFSPLPFYPIPYHFISSLPLHSPPNTSIHYYSIFLSAQVHSSHSCPLSHSQTTTGLRRGW